MGDRDAGKNDEAAGRKDPLAVIRDLGKVGREDEYPQEPLPVK